LRRQHKKKPKLERFWTAWKNNAKHDPHAADHCAAMTTLSDIPMPSDGAFAPTHWTLVLRAQGQTLEAHAALSELCAAYYQPVLRFLQREGREEEAARELTQEFFARVLQRGKLGAADPSLGPFRSYLLGAVKHFLADLGKHGRRQKRGSGTSPESLDAASTEYGSLGDIADAKAPVPDAWFDRQWALTVMDRTLNRLESEFRSAGKTEHFDQLKTWLVGETPALSQAEAARQLGLSEGALKVAIHRMRKRFRELIRTEIAQTVANGTDIDTELRYLIEALST
jgi:RNA polymerase sigma-70 factor (ECF subfamily)